MAIRLLSLAFLLFCSTLSRGQATFRAAPTAGPDVPAGLTEQILTYETFAFDTESLDRAVQADLAARSNSSVRLVIGEHDWTLQLYPVDLLAEDYYVSTGSGRQSTPRKQKAFRGYVNSNTADRVRLTVDGDFIYGFVEQGDAVYYLEPLRYFEGGQGNPDFVLYEQGAVAPLAKSCGVTEVAQHRPQADANRAAGICYVLELAIANDFLMFQKYGSVTGVENHNIAVINNVQGNYDDEFSDEIFFLITTQFVPTTAGADPFTTSTNVDNLIDDFRIWGQGGGFGGASYDLGEMWSDRDFDGSTVGYASVGVVCSSFRYHILQDFTSNATSLRVMTAHEMGHNWSMTHDASGAPFIMAPSVGSSSDWSTQSINQFTSHLADVVNGPNCLTGCGPPAPEFSATVTDICPGTTVQFSNNTSFSPTGFQWSFPGGVPATSTDASPEVTYDTPGTYNVELTATNSFGNVTETKVDYITVSTSGSDLLFSSDFENGLADWTVLNPDGFATWTTVTAPIGVEADNQAAYMDNYTYDGNGAIDELVSPAVNLSNRTSATFELQYAYARYDAQFRDSLVISVSSNNGASYTRLFAATEDSLGNFATRPDYEFPFVPEDETEWCIATTFGPSCLSLDLTPWVGFNQVRVKITNVNGYGNNMVVDNAQITASCLATGVQAPIANIGSDALEGCVPFQVQFSDQSANDPTSYQWEFEGGMPASSTDEDPLVTYDTPGVYDVTLIVGNGTGLDTAVFVNYITARVAPISDFTFVLVGNTVNFTNNSQNGNSFLWTFDNGQVSASINPSTTYPGPGTYNVTLDATNECGTVSTTQQVVISDQPSVAFTANPATGCNPLAVLFNNLTTNAVSYAWTFPGGTPSSSTSVNPIVAYLTPGSYSVTLAATNTAGTTTVTETDFIVVQSPVAAGFTFAAAGPNTFNFTSTSTNATGFNWDFGDGNTSTEENPTHTYATDGNFTVTLTAGNDCGSETATQTVSVSNPPLAAFTASTTAGCADLTVQFSSQNSSNAQSYAWVFQGGTPATSTDPNPTVVYQTAGSYDVSLSVSNGTGSDTADQSDFITVTDVPSPDFTFVVTGSTVDFTHTGSGATSYSWSFGDTNTSTAENPTHTYAADGTYTVVLTTTNACGSQTSTQMVTIANLPSAVFTASTTVGCADLTVQFNSQGSTNAQNYAWAFEGGVPATSTDPNPTVVYQSSGVFDVSLTVSNGTGSDVADQPDFIVVADVPSPDFTAQVNGQTVTFTHTGSGADSYSWDFGDSNTSTDENPVHTYAVDGNYTVTLVTLNGCGEAMTTQVVVVSTLPFAQFTATNTIGCTPLTVQFTNQSSANSTDLSWSFPGGDPATSTDANPTVIYNNPGVFSVTLTATNSEGNDQQTNTDYITVATTPNADFSFTLNGNTASFTNTTTGADSFSWNFGDGNSSILENPSNTYLNDGTYTVILSATNGCGTVTSTQQVVISSQPTAQFTASQPSGCAPFTVTFSNQSSGNVDDFSWVFPGGTPATSTAAEPTVTYNDAGTYDVTLTVSNGAGSDQQTQPAFITVGTAPVPNFSSQVNAQTVQFNYTGTPADSYSWNFGDGNSSAVQDPTHTYAADGDYTVVVTATNSCGSTTETQTVTVATQPAAQFTVGQTSGCTPFTVTFNNQSSPNATGFNWAFPGGTPAVSTDENPTVTYDAAGSFDVTLTAINSVGSDEQTQAGLITVSSAPAPAFTAQVNDQTVQFTYTGTPADSYSWDFGDGNTATGATPTHTYAGDDNYTVTITAANACGSVEVTQVVVVSTQPFAQFTADEVSGCAPFTVTFNNQSSGNSTGFAWSFPGGDPGSSTDENPTVTYTSAGSYDVELTASNAAGVNTVTQTAFITVEATPVADFLSFIDGLTVDFTDTGSGAMNYNWTFGDGSTSTTQSPTHTYAVDGTYTVTLTATNTCGTMTSTQTVTVVSAPQASFTADVTVACVGQVVSYTSTASDNTVEWLWTFQGGTPAVSTDPNPTVTYDAAGNYDVLLTVSNIAGSDQVTESEFIQIDDVPDAQFSVSSAGNTYTFTNTSTNADGFFWNFGDGNTSTADSPTHTYVLDGAYTVTLTATNDCGEMTATTIATVAMGAPIAAFSADQTTGCAPLTVQFENLSSDNADSFSWSFPGGTPATSTDPEPSVTYATAGSYTVSLTVTNVNGSDESEQTAFIEVLDTPTADFSFTANGTTVTFAYTGDAADTYSWNFGDGTTSDAASPTVTFAAPGDYPVTLTVTNDCGSDTFVSQVSVTAGAQIPVPSFGADIREGCGPFTVQFTDQSLNSPVSWNWTFEGGTPATSTDQNPTVTYDTAGEFDVQLQAGNTAGNNVLVSNDYITVGMAPDAEFTYAQAQYTYSFDAQSLGDSYTWDFGDGNTATGPAPIHTYATQGNFLVTFTVTNECGTSTKTEEIDVIVNNLEDYLSVTRFGVQPNPNNGQFTLLLEGAPSTEQLRIRLVDVLGRTLLSEVHSFNTGRLTRSFDEALASGVYLIQVSMNERTAVRKLIVD